MAQFDAAFSGSFTGTSASLTGVAVAANSNRALYVGIALGNGGARQVTEVSRDGQSASLVARVTQAEVNIEIWRILAPNVNTSAVSVAVDTTTDHIVVGAVSLYDVDQTTPNGTVSPFSAGSGGGAGNPWSLNVTAAGTSDLVLDFLGVTSGSTSFAVTPGAGQTQRIVNASSTWRTLAVSTKPGVAGTVTMTEDSVTVNGNSYAAFVVNNASGGGGNAAPTFPGPNIADINATQNAAIAADTISDSFSDTDALTFSAIGTWPAGVVVTSAGVIQGTPTETGTFSNLGVRAMDTASQTVDSNAFQIVVTAPGDAVLPTHTGSITSSNITHNSFKIDWPAGADNVAVTGYEYSLNGGTNWTNAGNVLTVTPTGLSASTAYPVQVRAYDAAGNRSTPPLSSTVTTTAASGDVTIPTQTGAITVSNVTSSGFKLTWPSASDNVGVFGYEVSIDGGTTYTNVGSVLTITETGRPASTAHQVRVRAYDAAGNRSSPLSATATTLAAASGTITTDPFTRNNGTLRTGLSGLVVAVLDLATLAYVKNFTGRTTDGTTGRMTISATEIVAGSWYAVVTVDANGVLGVEKYQAA